MPKKLCPKCKHRKCLTEFYPQYDRPDKVQSHCKECHKAIVRRYQEKNKEKCKAASLKWQAENKDRWRTYGKEYQRKHALKYRLRKYGLTLDEYRKLYDKHDGRCHICKTEPLKHLRIDHCHDTGRVRGLLCGGCNTMIGFAEDNIYVLNAAIQYLKART